MFDNDLTRLRALFLSQFYALVAKYPAQQGNEAYYQARARNATCARVARRVSTKGNHSTYSPGDVVLVWRDAHTTIWHPRNDCATIVDSSAVEVL